MVKKAKLKTGTAKRKNQSVSRRIKAVNRKLKTNSPPIGRGYDQLLVNEIPNGKVAESRETQSASKHRESQSSDELDSLGWHAVGTQEQRDNPAAVYREMLEYFIASSTLDKPTRDAISELLSLETIKKIIECIKRDPGNSWSRKQTPGLEKIPELYKWAKRWGFHITKYKAHMDLGASDWRREIGIRRLLWITLSLDETKAFSGDMLKALIENLSIDDVATMDEKFSRQSLRIPDSTNVLACPTFNVRPLDAQTAFEHAKQVVDFSEKVMAGKYGNDIKCAFENNGTSIDVLFWKAGIRNPFGHLLVNLCGGVPDEMLTQEFDQSSEWLGTQLSTILGFNPESAHLIEMLMGGKYMNRKRLSPRTEPFTDEDFKRWHENQVLPYIDLRLAARFDQIKLSVDDIATLLFPHCADAHKRLNRIKPTKFLAEELGKNVALWQLIPHGHAEIARKKPSA